MRENYDFSRSELLRNTMNCPLCNGLVGVSLEIDKIKNCSCTRCGESSIPLEVSTEMAIAIWNYHCETVSRVIGERRASIVPYFVDDEGRTAIIIDRVHEISDIISRLNHLNLGEVYFMLEGQKLEIDASLIEEFRFTGLANIDFIRTGFYTGTFNEEEEE